ncbi:MFS transporter [Aestuariicella hydrocarbonica]|uniref:MFS transporter n=1 Tax=Pseudomaricurvus hydrocarbonicus TaxID=1470433 RepID=A0A9E5ML00_9GAMM|nr:MFS transporter [Aestuariicella hydrocarbonica]NHO66127.1 MFS transporter [Aestuariicella hydrocarbonica]
MNTADPREVIAQSPLSRPQIVVIILCILLNALDGFDVLAISFASPGIAETWGVDRAALGLVLSMELIGMAIGSIVLGSLADRIGRRPTILGCLTIMSGGMYLAAIANDITTLSVVRFITGLGIGGMLASTNAMVAEFSNRRRRHLAVALMAGGYPVGAIIGGIIASMLLAHFDWRSVFIFGAIATAAFLPLAFFCLPESVEYLVQKRPKNALHNINNIMRKMGHSAVEALPVISPQETRTGLRELLSPQLVRITLLLTVAYFAHIMTFYFILKWIPKIVVDMGFVASTAGGVLVWANVGGAAGALVLSLLTQKIDVRNLVIGAMVMAFVMVTVFGYSSPDLQQLSLFAALAGFFTNSAVVGLYAIFAQAFPTRVRAGGTGLVIGVGRGGAALGPVVAGVLFSTGQSLPTVALLMALGSLLAAAALLLLKPSGDKQSSTGGKQTATCS